MSINRIQPAMPASSYKTYEISAPVSTHFRPARNCAEAECSMYERGWKSVFDESTELGLARANYVRRSSGRRFTESRSESGLTEFFFEAGQNCFGLADHRIRLEREANFLVVDGDWRGNPRGTAPKRHANATDWRDDFAEHQDSLATRLAQG